MSPESEKPRSRGLGRGLSALLGEGEAFEEGRTDSGAQHPPAGTRTLPIELISPNPEQPRRAFDDGELAELAESIAEKGVIQPILVRPVAGPSEHYQIVAGERRWRAAQRAQLHEIPVVIRELTDRETLEIAIVENVQRADLNPVEEARALRQLVKAFGHTQEEVARVLGKSRAHVANTLRLLSLPEPVLHRLAAGELSAGHARAIQSAADPVALADHIVSKGLSVRAAEALARSAAGKMETKSRKGPGSESKDADTRALEADLTGRLGLEVGISNSGESGEVRIRYATLEQLDEICKRLSQSV